MNVPDTKQASNTDPTKTGVYNDNNTVYVNELAVHDVGSIESKNDGDNIMLTSTAVTDGAGSNASGSVDLMPQLTCISVNESQRLLIGGTDEGDVYIWSIDMTKIVNYFIQHHHDQPHIYPMYSNSKLVSVSFLGYVHHFKAHDSAVQSGKNSSHILHTSNIYAMLYINYHVYLIISLLYILTLYIYHSYIHTIL